ncbi:hypothetical protein FRB99_008344 [Tulasnella sp. 403]|nr:hypothetical protein FRB99_008344 [Tulasnella sp. 403]
MESRGDRRIDAVARTVGAPGAFPLAGEGDLYELRRISGNRRCKLGRTLGVAEQGRSPEIIYNEGALEGEGDVDGDADADGAKGSKDADAAIIPARLTLGASTSASTFGWEEKKVWLSQDQVEGEGDDVQLEPTTRNPWTHIDDAPTHHRRRRPFITPTSPILLVTPTSSFGTNVNPGTSSDDIPPSSTTLRMQTSPLKAPSSFSSLLHSNHLPKVEERCLPTNGPPMSGPDIVPSFGAS